VPVWRRGANIRPRRTGPQALDPAQLKEPVQVAGSTVLVVDDEPRIVEFLLENLRADDYSVLTASNGEEAIDVLSRTRPDLILLDVVLPGMSGIDVCRRVRGGDAVNDPWDPNLPIIMLSAKAEHTDRVRGLSRGADDYVTKPFHYPELLARIAGLLKRVSRTDDRHRLVVSELVVNTLSKQVTVGGVAVQLSVKEFQLLATLASDPERVFSKQELLEVVWGFKSPGRTRTLDSHASRLRQKLAIGSDRPWIVNVWGHGYRVCTPE
jgi:DNA-binding response OmpR family regulator